MRLYLMTDALTDGSKTPTLSEDEEEGKKKQQRRYNARKQCDCCHFIMPAHLINRYQGRVCAIELCGYCLDKTMTRDSEFLKRNKLFPF